MKASELQPGTMYRTSRGDRVRVVSVGTHYKTSGWRGQIHESARGATKADVLVETFGYGPPGTTDEPTGRDVIKCGQIEYTEERYQQVRQERVVAQQAHTAREASVDATYAKMHADLQTELDHLLGEKAHRVTGYRETKLDSTTVMGLIEALRQIREG